MNNQQLILLLSLDLPTKLSKEQSKQLADEFIFLEKRIAELEKNLNISECLSEERREFIINGVELGYISIPDDKIDPAYFTFWRCQLENSYAFDSMKLEQQAKALEELLTYPNHRFHGDSRLYYSEYSINRAIENLRKQTKGGDV